MGDRDLELLEFHKIKEILAGFTSFSASRQLALDLRPLLDKEEVCQRLRESAEARHMLSLSPDFSIGEVVDIREVVEMAARGKVLEPTSLLEIERTLGAGQRLKCHLMDLTVELPLLSSLAGDIVELKQLQKDIGGCLTPTGDLADTASPRMASVRNRMREVRQELLSQLQAIIRSPRRQKIIQDAIITERGGRYVIPVREECRRQMKGIVHDVSNTEATVFIEPWATIDLQNDLRQLTMEEKHEVERILRMLSSEVGAYEHEISHNIELIAEIDMALAKARYAREAKATEPLMVSAGRNLEAKANQQAGVFRLVEARHPLLGSKAVPLSVEIGRDFSILVITGPNTGGKTVALKTIGLLSLMAQAGLPIPALAESCIPLFDGVYADIGDEQSIEQTLSTFSWHIGNIVRINNSASERSLVLLDELGTNTDPGEGSALARSILLYFLAQGTMTVATTHYTELKALAHTTRGMLNAALDVDPVTMSPTYHLTVGIPGGSNAMATASRLGLAAEIVTRAQQMLSEGTQELGDLLAYLGTERQSIDSLRHSLEKEFSEAQQKSAQLENRLRQLEAERQKIIKDIRDQVVREAAGLHRELREAAAELRRDKSRKGIEQAKQALTAVRKQLNNEAWRAGTAIEMCKQEGETGVITVGDTVWLKEVGMSATVLSVSEERGLVEVHAGKVKMILNLDSVEKRTRSTGKVKPGGAVITKKLSKLSIPLELDLRGKRAEEVELALDDYLNEASLYGLSQVRIIHGIGTGTVRQIVREVLASHSLVASFRAGGKGEGGEGVTIASM